MSETNQLKHGAIVDETIWTGRVSRRTYCIGENNVHKKDVIHRERTNKIYRNSVLLYYVKYMK
jgi:hypothetical protein